MDAIIKKADNFDSKVIITGFFEDKKELSEIQTSLDKKYSGVFSKNIIKNFSGKFLETMTFPLENGSKITVVGLGKYKEFDLNKLRECAAKGLLSSIKYIEEGKAAIEIIQSDFDLSDITASAILGIGIGEYKFDKYKTQKKENRVTTVEILTNENNDKIEQGIKYGIILNDSLNFTKNLVNESAEVMTPAKVAEIAKQLSINCGAQIKIYNKEELKKMGFGAFLAVGQGSFQEPKFIHLTYTGKNPKKKIVLIGKGITFDSGGLDIKPPASMLTMKTDMTGCATVLGVMKAICEIKPDIELHCMSALCENMPSGSSYKTGDVLTTKSGKTIEVDNTDAEGRITLADVLTYADEINPDEVIDIATLTGAVIVALGNNITGIMGNNQNQIEEFKKAAAEAGERVWQLPIYDDMMDSLKSDIADMKNTGSRHAGSSVAGRFLQNYTESKKWLHIDIAGTAYIDKAFKETPKGATGVMLRTLVHYLLK